MYDVAKDTESGADVGGACYIEVYLRNRDPLEGLKVNLKGKGNEGPLGDLAGEAGDGERYGAGSPGQHNEDDKRKQYRQRSYGYASRLG